LEQARFVSLDEVAVSSETLLPHETVSIENRARYCNIANHNVEFGKHMARDVYIARRAEIDAVKLIRLPPGSVICGGGEYMVRIGDDFVAEQFPPYVERSGDALRGLGQAWRAQPTERADLLLVARHGIATWGHWLGELLPKIVLAEKLHPGRFRYILPRDVLRDERPDWPWVKLRQSLAAYAVPPESIFEFGSEVDTRFDNLYAVSEIWSDHMMHPGAADWLRHAVRIGRPAAEIGRLAVARLAGSGRSLENWPEVERILAARGFTTVATGTLPFAEQVAMFQGADMVFGVLGSDLTNLIFSPRGVRVMTAAPATFGDRFFYALVLDRDGHMADVRGPASEGSARAHFKSSFSIGLDQLRNALLVLEGIS
jgi:hypothetical protein